MHIQTLHPVQKQDLLPHPTNTKVELKEEGK